MSPLADALIAAWNGPARPVWDGETTRLGDYSDDVVSEWRPVAAGQVCVTARMPEEDAVRVVGFLAALRDERAGVVR